MPGWLLCCTQVPVLDVKIKRFSDVRQRLRSTCRHMWWDQRDDDKALSCDVHQNFILLVDIKTSMSRWCLWLSKVPVLELQNWGFCDARQNFISHVHFKTSMVLIALQNPRIGVVETEVLRCASKPKFPHEDARADKIQRNGSSGSSAVPKFSYWTSGILCLCDVRQKVRFHVMDYVQWEEGGWIFVYHYATG